MSSSRIKRDLTKLFLFVAIGIFLFSSGFKLGKIMGERKNSTSNVSTTTTIPKITTPQNIDLSLLWDVWKILEKKYVNKKALNPQKMYYGAIKGMVQSLGDPYTFFLTPKENKEAKDDLGGKFEGIGAQLGLKDGKIVVISPLKNSPAQKAGLKAGDIIIKVDGHSTKDWNLFKAVKEIRGKKGTKVTLTVLRDGEEKDIVITRGEIHVPSIEVKKEQNITCNENCKKVGYIRINQFGDSTLLEWDKAAYTVYNWWRKKEIKGLVLDLRDNPGGYLNDAVYIASEFLPQGKLVVTQESSNGTKKEYRVKRQGMLLEIPLVILINKGSASASEILAGSLRDYNRARLVGTKSFGKGSVQQALDLRGGAGLHVTIAKWILPKGEWINGKGLKPNIKVENKVEKGNTLTRKNDIQLEKAIKLLVK